MEMTTTISSAPFNVHSNISLLVFDPLYIVEDISTRALKQTSSSTFRIPKLTPVLTG